MPPERDSLLSANKSIMLSAQRRPAVYLLGLTAIATGIVNLIFGNFDPAEEPIQAFGNHIRGQIPFAYVVAVLLVLGGAALLSHRAARFGAPVLAALYSIFAVFWLPRFYWAPHILGQHPGIYIGILGGVCQNVIVVVAAAIVYAAARDAEPSRRFAATVRWIFGLCAVDFGLTQLTGIHATAIFVPKWIPLGGNFWAVATGIFFVLAGIGIVSGMLDVLAARLLALMLFVFSALALAPQLFLYPHAHAAWGVNVYNLAAVGAVWIFSDWLAAREAGLKPALRAEPQRGATPT
jgi:uncharacterized membrane protein YphA (DoxX/SURF4 family)